ncbi:MAG: transcriptional repressor [Solirubrobacterales bacterium]|nr:transcriptional repressor [Solirubrobacterales bacterium]
MPRPSHVRDAVAALLRESGRHDWAIDEVLAALHGQGVAADYSSVFRALARLEADGAVRRVELGDGKARYEAAGDHHEHVRCDRCGTVGEVPGCAVRAVLPHVAEQTDFVITGHTLVFSGLCPACVENAR